MIYPFSSFSTSNREEEGTCPTATNNPSIGRVVVSLFILLYIDILSNFSFVLRATTWEFHIGR